MRIIVNEVNYKACNYNKKEALVQVFTCVYFHTEHLCLLHGTL